MQRKDERLGKRLGKTTGWAHRMSLKDKQVVMHQGVQYDKIDENGNLHITQDGKPKVLEVDNIVVCAGQVEYRELLDQAKQNGEASNVYTIGGAQMAGELDAKRAIDMGTRLALKIHDSAVVPGKHVFSAEKGVEEQVYKLLRKFA